LQATGAKKLSDHWHCFDGGIRVPRQLLRGVFVKETLSMLSNFNEPALAGSCLGSSSPEALSTFRNLCFEDLVEVCDRAAFLCTKRE
jgi:hypothetical protein